MNFKYFSRLQIGYYFSSVKSIRRVSVNNLCSYVDLLGMTRIKMQFCDIKNESTMQSNPNTKDHKIAKTNPLD